MAQVRKYGFDTEFAPDGKILNANAPGVRKLTTEDLEAERKAGYESGKKDALAQAEREAAAALQQLAGAASAILTRLDAESRAMREDAARIALAAARKIAGAALEKYGADHAAAAVEAAMDALRHQPRLLVKLSPEATESLRPRIEEMCATHAYAGAVLVRAEPGLKQGEVIIDWSDGVISLDPAQIATQIETLVEAALSAAHANTRTGAET
jgi:flagellar assembly protein FliH